MTFSALPARLVVTGDASGSVVFNSVDPAAARAAVARREEARRRDEEERARKEAADRDRRFDEATRMVADLSRTVGESLERELTALEPQFARLAHRIAERAVRTRLSEDPLLLLPAVENAMKRVRAGVDQPSLVSLHVEPTAADRFAEALSRHGGSVRVVAEPEFESGRFEVRCDIRRVRYSIAREFETIANDLEAEVSHG